MAFAPADQNAAPRATFPHFISVRRDSSRWRSMSFTSIKDAFSKDEFDTV
ncbi:MAG TPA: hypothetical protein V6D06_00130 [Trichocoleus sp.]